MNPSRKEPQAAPGGSRSPDKPTILIVEGDEGLRRSLAASCLGHGLEVHETPDRSEALQRVRQLSPDLVIVGSSPDGTWDGVELAQAIRREERTLPLILIMTTSTESLAIAALKAGVADYFKQPVSLDELMATVTRLLGRSFPPQSQGGADLPGGRRMVGESQAVRAILAHVHRVAFSDSTVLITGETGTGKELVAELIHETGRRRGKPLVRINCAAIPDSLLESELFGYERGAFTGAHATHAGKLELANGGAVLFDEISDMTPYAQAKILRVIETKEAFRLGGNKRVPLDIRVIAATNQDLEPLVATGNFRRDLYFRLNVVRIQLPPLRERREDIPLLVDYYVRDLNRRLGVAVTAVTATALEALIRYEWPGNVRELKNLLEALMMDRPRGRIFYSNLPSHIRRWSRKVEAPDPNAETTSERDRVLAALFRANWNKGKAAEQLHWSRMTLYRKISKYRITRSDEASSQTGKT